MALVCARPPTGAGASSAGAGGLAAGSAAASWDELLSAVSAGTAAVSGACSAAGAGVLGTCTTLPLMSSGVSDVRALNTVLSAGLPTVL